MPGARERRLCAVDGRHAGRPQDRYLHRRLRRQPSAAVRRERLAGDYAGLRAYAAAGRPPPNARRGGAPANSSNLRLPWWLCAASRPTAKTCNGDEFNNAVFPNALAGTPFVAGKCRQGYAGSPTRNCTIDGTFSDETAASVPCTRTCRRIPRIGPPGSQADFVLISRDALLPARWCAALAAVTCSSTTETAVVWPSAAAGTTVNGQCASGYFGNPTRTCTNKGIWLTPVGQCQRTPPRARGPRRQTGGAATNTTRATVLTMRPKFHRRQLPARQRRDGVVRRGAHQHRQRRGYLQARLHRDRRPAAAPRLRRGRHVVGHAEPVHSYARRHGAGGG